MMAAWERRGKEGGAEMRMRVREGRGAICEEAWERRDREE
jgi:hypothetical protein